MSVVLVGHLFVIFMSVLMLIFLTGGSGDIGFGGPGGGGIGFDSGHSYPGQVPPQPSYPAAPTYGGPPTQGFPQNPGMLCRCKEAR